jgi:hypothetical protein
VTHTTPRRGRPARNEADDRLGVCTRLVVVLEVLGCLLLHRATNLTNDDDTLCGGVIKEDLEHINVLRARERVATNTDTERLAETGSGRLCDGLVGERARTRDDA